MIAGGGATGVEYACGLLELFRVIVPRDYPEIDPGEISVSILQGAGTLIQDFPAPLREYAKRRVESLGGFVQFRTHVEDFDGRTIHLSSGKTLDARALIWAAGVTVPPLAKEIPGDRIDGGRIQVDGQLRLAAFPDIQVLGDLSHLPEGPSPQVAPFVIQTARHAAQAVLASWNLAPLPSSFLYRDPGSMVVLGRFDAICQIPCLNARWHGSIAWSMWLGLHFAKIMGTRNRLLALADWGQDYLFRSAAMEILRPPQTPADSG